MSYTSLLLERAAKPGERDRRFHTQNIPMIGADKVKNLDPLGVVEDPQGFRVS